MVLWGKVGVPGQAFLRFLLRRGLQPTFSSIFGRFLTKKSMFFSLLFSSHPCFFLDMATFTIVWFFPIETYFFIFCFFVFFCKKWSKINVKKQMKKRVENWPPRIPFWTPKSTKSGQRASQNGSKIEKKMIFEGLIFWWFFGWPKKSLPEVIPLIDVWLWRGLGLPGGYRGYNKRQPNLLVV